MEFTLTAENAKKGEQRSNRIQEHGKYIGVFTQVLDIVSGKKKTKGIQFSFKQNETDMTADYLTLWVENAAGERLMGSDAIETLMCCMKIKKLKSEKGMAKVYEDGKLGDKECDIYPDLINEPIGIVLEKTLYTKENGFDAEQYSFAAFFNAESGKSASEILDGTDATVIDKIVSTLKIIDNRKEQGASAGVKDSDFDDAGSADFDDDIPF